jgi:hypothetical protein
MAQTFEADGVTQTIRSRYGSGQAGPRLGLYEEETTQSSSLGLALDVDDGAVYRYSHFVAAVTPGKLSAMDISVAGFASIDGKFTNSAGAAKDDYGTDDDIIFLTDTGTFQSENDAKNVWAGGYLFVTDGPGEGFKYRIKSHPQPEVEPATAGTIKLVLQDKLGVATGSEASVAIIGNPYKNLTTATTTDNFVTGSTVRSMTAGSFGWAQTRGWANVLIDGEAAIQLGGVAVLSDDDAGAAKVFGLASLNSQDDLVFKLAASPIIGSFGHVSADTEYGPVFLTLQG